MTYRWKNKIKKIDCVIMKDKSAKYKNGVTIYIYI